MGCTLPAFRQDSGSRWSLLPGRGEPRLGRIRGAVRCGNGRYVPSGMTSAAAVEGLTDGTDEGR